MKEQDKSDAAPSQLPGLAVVAIILGLFVFKDTAFESSRPVMSDLEKNNGEDVRSRLWQDPFEAVAQHLKKINGRQEVLQMVREQSGKDARYDNEDGHQIVELDDEYAIQSGKLPQRICNSIEDIKTKENVAEPARAHSIEELRCQIQRNPQIIDKKTDASDLLVLAVMVPGGPYAEDREWRLRSRYALVSGVAAAGYRPKDSEHIGFVDYSKVCQDALGLSHKENVQFCELPAQIPYEWFKKDEDSFPDMVDSDKPGKILVLWLANNVFGNSNKPLSMLQLLKEQITPKESEKKFGKPRLIKPRYHVIGPQDSGTFASMYQEVSDIADNCSRNDKKKDTCVRDYFSHLQDSFIFSPFASLDLTDRIGKGNSQGIQLDKNNVKWLKDRVIRTIGSSDKLAVALHCELLLRGVKPFDFGAASAHSKFNQFIENECKFSESEYLSFLNKDKHHIVLIGEKDTVYSRNLTESFKKILTNYGVAQNKDIDRWISTFSYLRGIDGVTAKESNAIRKDNQDSDEFDLNKKNSDKALRRPTGPNQFDYLRRLALQIEDLHRSKLEKDGNGIKAIGVLGTDPYDKLLILQALYKRFPHALFFTTDLDARFLHPVELQWTRNLIVASPYGLALHEKFQKGTPSFRDTYQTALYLTIQFAVDCWRQEQNSNKLIQAQCNSPDFNTILDEKILEKNPRLFEIGNHKAVDLSRVTKNTIHPDSEAFQMSKQLDVQELVVFSLFILLLTLIFCRFFVPSDIRKFIYGLSIALLCVMLLFFCMQSLDKTSAETYSFTNGVSTWPANAIRLFAVVIAILFFVQLRQRLKASNEEISQHFSVTQSPQDQINLIDNTPPQERCSLLIFIDNWGKSKQETEHSLYFTELWECYCKYRGYKQCAFRIFIMFMLYLACIILIFRTGYFEMPGFPARGETNYTISWAILLICVFMYLILIFSIADISFLSSQFIRLLKENEIIWPDKIVNNYCHKYGLCKNVVKQKLLMDFIEKLAGAVNSFIYYPFIILFLIILSRSHYFDNWHYTPMLFFIISFTALIALLTAIRLRKTAIDAKGHILEKLDHDYWSMLSNDAQEKNNERVMRTQRLMDEIKNLNKGPFLPLRQHPAVLSVFFPVGSVGGLYMVEYFLAAA